MQMRSKKSFVRNRTGASTVEFAIAASLLFMVLMASFEFSRFVFVRNSLDQAAYEACRFGIIQGHSVSDVRTHADEFLKKVGIREGNIVVNPATIDSTTRQVTVTIQADFAKNSWITPSFTGNSLLRSSVTLDHENLAVRPANQ